MTSARKREAEQRGRMAEDTAAAYLRAQGYEIESTRYRSKNEGGGRGREGEVDIIARRDDLILFVEVKARKTAQFALDDITVRAQRRIETAGEKWIESQPDGASLSWRYDVIAIVPGKPPLHFENVW
ncbi:MAG: YraN family protein [Pseudomonadota bacterium]